MQLQINKTIPLRVSVTGFGRCTSTPIENPGRFSAQVLDGDSSRVVLVRGEPTWNVLAYRIGEVLYLCVVDEEGIPQCCERFAKGETPQNQLATQGLRDAFAGSSDPAVREAAVAALF